MGQCCGCADDKVYMSLNKNNEGFPGIRTKPTKRYSDDKAKKNIFDLHNGSALKIKMFMKHHDISQLIFNGNGGVYESYLCLPK